MPAALVLSREVTDALRKAEQQIQRIMLDLDEEIRAHGQKVDDVRVDTRNFANMATEIFTKPTR